MGIYVNPDNREFQRVLNDYIYIDKTDLIVHTNNRLGRSSRYLCVSRPRRFGKSMAADMLVAYYSKGCCSAPLFSNRKIEKENSYKEHLNKHNVIRIDVQRFITSKEDLQTFIEDMQLAVIRDLIKEFPQCKGLSEMIKLQTACEKVYADCGASFIFILDEWDCVFRVAQNEPELQKKYLDFLRGLFKGAVYVELAYMTGILPIKKYGEHSAVNMFDEYSMTDPKNMGSCFGFTGEEVLQQCEKQGISFPLMEQWYDGYLLGEDHIYNPKSVVDALTWKKFKSYWTGTETYEALKVYIERNFDGLKEAVIEMIGGAACPVDPTTFQNDMTSFASKDDVLTLLVHLGYLTYDETREEVSIPNREVAQEFVRSIKTGAGWGNLMDSLNASAAVLQRTWELDEVAVAEAIQQARRNTSSIIRYHDENSLSYAVYTAYAAAESYYLKPIREFPSGRGFADIVYLPRRDCDKPALLIELKWNHSAKGAIAQIKEKNYADWVRDYCGEILLIGINYNKKTDTHTCAIEKFRK